MASNDPADHGGRRHGAEHIVQVAVIYNQHLDSMEESLLQAIRDMHSYIGPNNIAGAPILLIYTVVKLVRQKLILVMGRQDMNPRSRLAFALIAVALGCVGCSLLMYLLLGDMPWPIFAPCVLLLIVPFAFIAN